MSGTTTNYGWTYPTSTDYVKDGATAIQTLATGIDTSLNTALGTKPAAAVLLKTQTVTAASSIAIDSVFNSTYQNYTLYFNAVQNTSDGLWTFKYRAATVDSSSAFYQGGTSNGYNTATITAYRVNGATACDCGGARAGDEYGEFRLDIIQPYVASTKTRHNIQGVWNDASSIYGFASAGVINVTTQFDGIKIITNAGTFTGTARIYGWNN